METGITLINHSMIYHTSSYWRVDMTGKKTKQVHLKNVPVIWKAYPYATAAVAVVGWLIGLGCGWWWF